MTSSVAVWIFKIFQGMKGNHLHLGTEGCSLLIVYLCAPVYMNACENTCTYLYTYEFKQHVGMGLLVSPLNPCGHVIPAVRDSPRQELAVSVIPLTFVPPSFFCAVKFLSFLISHFLMFFVFLSSLNFPLTLCHFLTFLVIKLFFSHLILSSFGYSSSSPFLK